MTLLRKMYMRLSKREIVFIISAVLLVMITVGGTIAYLTSATAPVENEFTPGKVSCEVIETFENNIKKDVAVKNTGNTEAFIRVAVLATFVDEAGNIFSQMPVEGVDYSIEFDTVKWTKGTDGFWYYREKVEPEKFTDKLINQAVSLDTAPEGYSCSIEIIATAIQANSESVVTSCWGATVRNGYRYIE